MSLGAGAYAAVSGGSPGSTATITACVHHKGGGLYIARRCAPPNTRLYWNGTGPQGVLPSGATETGVWAVRWDAAGEGESGDAVVSFDPPLAAGPTAIDCGGTACTQLARFAPQTNTTACPGTVTAPAATPGTFCIYIGQSVNLNGLSAADPSGVEGSISAIGGELSPDSASSGDTIARGTWAVTEP